MYIRNVFSLCPPKERFDTKYMTHHPHFHGVLSVPCHILDRNITVVLQLPSSERSVLTSHTLRTVFLCHRLMFFSTS